MGTTPHEVTWSPLAASLVRNPIRTLFERCQRDKEIIALVGGKPTASLFPVREMTLSLAAGGALAAPLDEACMNYGPHQAGGTAALREWGAARVARECAPPFEDWAEANNINAPKLAVTGTADLRGVLVIGAAFCCPSSSSYTSSSSWPFASSTTAIWRHAATVDAKSLGRTSTIAEEYCLPLPPVSGLWGVYEV